MKNPTINELFAIRRHTVLSYLSDQKESELKRIFAKLYCLLSSDVPADDHLQEKIKLLLDKQYDLKVIKYRNYEEDWQKGEFKEALSGILSIYKHISYAEFAPNKREIKIGNFILGFVASWIAFMFLSLATLNFAILIPASLAIGVASCFVYHFIMTYIPYLVASFYIKDFSKEKNTFWSRASLEKQQEFEKLFGEPESVSEHKRFEIC